MQSVYEFLKKLGINYEYYDHPAVFTCEEADKVCGMIPGKQAKNLFLKGEKGDRFYLVTIPHDKRADLKALAANLGERRLRFGNAQELMKKLGLTPGSVSPLGLVNNVSRDVAFIMDEEFLAEPKIYVHPNANTATVGITPEDFKKLIFHLGSEMRVMKF